MTALRIAMGSALPVATAHGTAPRRLWAYLTVGPRRPIGGAVEWARRLAFASTAAHVAIFSCCVLVRTWSDAHHDGFDDALLAVALVVSALLLGGAQMVLTFLAMLLTSMAAAPLSRLRRPVAVVLGAAWAGAVLLFIEPVASGMWLALADRMEVPRALFWLAAAITGGLWGAWLGLADASAEAPAVTH